MKRINKITTALFLPLIMLFSSCFDPIFYEVRRDVEPESATVSGNIGQITRFTMNGEEYLFLSADGGLRYKKADNETHGSWATMSVPFALSSFDFDNTAIGGRQIIGVYANKDTLYLVAAQYKTTSSEGTTNPTALELWGYSDQDEDGTYKWVHINKDSDINYFPIYYDSVKEIYKSNFNVFQTNAPQQANRKAYICSFVKNADETTVSYKYFELIGTDDPSQHPITISKVEDGTADSRVYSAVWFNGGVKFFNSSAATTDETLTNPAERIFYASGSYLYYSTLDEENNFVYKRSCTASDTISALAVTKDSILIGLGNITSTSSDSGGITRVLRDSEGKPLETTSDFTTNANFQITSIYKVLALINATPEKTEEESALYASITFSSYSGLYDNIGLWSYYPARGNWNRE